MNNVEYCVPKRETLTIPTLCKRHAYELEKEMSKS